MVFPFKYRIGMALGCACLVLCISGCLSYRIVRQIEGSEINDPAAEFVIGESTLGEVLAKLGAPDEVLSVANRDLLIYERSLLYENRLSLGVPLLDVAFGGSVDLSAYGSLTRYDTLAFFFSSQGVLDQWVFEKGSKHPYVKTLLSK